MKRNQKPITQFQHGAFTLMELLVVIAIIAILAGILILVVGRAKTKAKVAAARVEMAGLELAIKSYHNDYSRWPYPSDPVANSFGDLTFGYSEDPSDASGSFRDNSLLMRILMAEDPTRNPKKNIYIEPKESLLEDIDNRSGFPGVSISGRYHDPFGNPYIVSLDYNGDGNCTDAFYGQPGVTGNASIGLVESDLEYVLKGKAKGKVMIWTFGPDKESSSGEGAMDGDNADNILSWR